MHAAMHSQPRPCAVKRGEGGGVEGDHDDAGGDDDGDHAGGVVDDFCEKTLASMVIMMATMIVTMMMSLMPGCLGPGLSCSPFPAWDLVLPLARKLSSSNGRRKVQTSPGC